VFFLFFLFAPTIKIVLMTKSSHFVKQA